MAGQTVVRKPDEGRALWFLNGIYEVIASADETGGKLSAMLMTVPPGSGPPPHVHDCDEAVYVLEGKVRYHIDGKAVEAGPGTFFFIPQGVEENFEAAGDEPIKVLVLYSPGGMDRFFTELGEPAQRRELPTPSEPDLELIARVAEKHGLQIKAPAPT